MHIVPFTVDGKELPEFGCSLNFDSLHGEPEFVYLFCQQRKEKNSICRYLISTSHDVVLLLQQPGKILWSREESLASILSVEMISLPVSDTDAAIEKEFNDKNCKYKKKKIS